MAYTDRELLKQQQAGALGTTGAASPTAEVGFVHSDCFIWDKAADDGMASTTTSETYTGIYFPRKCKLKSVTYVATTGGITADDTNNATITVKSRDSGGANPATVATLTTNTAAGNVTQGAGKALTNATTTDIVMAAGSTLTVTIAKAGTGVVVRAGRFTAHVEWV